MDKHEVKLKIKVDVEELGKSVERAEHVFLKIQEIKDTFAELTSCIKKLEIEVE